MKTNLLWIIAIFLAAASQWHIIEIKKQSPNKPVWFLVRVIAFSGFMWWYMELGYMWYWAAAYMIFTFAWLFPFMLNIMRAKYFGYMSASGSWYDRQLIRLFGKEKIETLYFYFGFIFMLIAILLQLVYGQTEFSAI